MKGGQTLPTFSVNLFGIPEIPEALPSAISPARLHNIVFISSCNLVCPAYNPFPQLLAAGGATSFSPRVPVRMASYTRASKWAIRVTRRSTGPAPPAFIFCISSPCNPHPLTLFISSCSGEQFGSCNTRSPGEIFIFRGDPFGFRERQVSPVLPWKEMRVRYDSVWNGFGYYARD